MAIAAAGWWSSPDVQIPALSVRVTSAQGLGKVSAFGADLN